MYSLVLLAVLFKFIFHVVKYLGRVEVLFGLIWYEEKCELGKRIVICVCIWLLCVSMKEHFCA